MQSTEGDRREHRPTTRTAPLAGGESAANPTTHQGGVLPST
ncbi:hypothetical protein [Halarchaeum sp. CBA1220]|nr:hypothetical protein [Halarchaeum sp. CBA1220]